MVLLARLRRSRRSLVAVAAAALVVSACGGGGGSGGDSGGGGSASSPGQTSGSGLPTTAGLVGVSDTGAQPVRGGTLTFATYLEAPTLDPAKGYGGWGVAGDIELAAIYDSLVRYQPSDGTYVPQLAESLTPSADFATWTMKLRPGVKFTDGTPLNAEAVVFSMQRMLTLKSQSVTEVEQVEKYETPDDLTVVFHLTSPWKQFPITLAGAPGHIVSPTAVQKEGDGFAKQPVGAGPFMLESLSPGESLILKANPGYWDGQPYLDKVRFVPNLSGDATKLDSLKTGEIQAAFLRDPETVVEARADGYPGYANPTSGGNVLKINNADGRPGADVRVRQAISDALNPDELNQRVDQGKGLWAKEIFQEGSIWHTDVAPSPYDTDQAKKLLAAAKADGYNGKLTLVCDNSPTNTTASLAMQAQLNAVGFDTQIDRQPNAGAATLKVNVKGDYDIACNGVVIPQSAPWLGFALQWKTGGIQNHAGYSDPKMDALIDELHGATTEQAQHDVITKIEQLWAQTVPSVYLATTVEFVAWDKSVHGILPTARTDVLLGKAWIGKS